MNAIEHPQVMPTGQDEAAADALLRAILSRAADPGDRLPVDQWAEGRLTLSRRVTSKPGPVRLQHTPYMRGPLLAWTTPRYSRVLCVWGAQTGKTLTMQIVIGYDIDQDPGPGMVVYPDQHSAKKRSRKHLRTLIEDSEILRRHKSARADDMQTYEYALDTMTLNVGWAGSASVLASEPLRKLYRDEIGKWRRRDKDEGDPLLLSQRRILSYGSLGKVYDATTPSTKQRPGWEDLAGKPEVPGTGSTFHEYWVPCPHCGKPADVVDVPYLVTDGDLAAIRSRMSAAGYQVLTWGQFRGWHGAASPAAGGRATYYECEHCKGRVEDRDKPAMTAAGKWVPRVLDRETAGFHLPSWYRCLPTTSFGAVARRFLEAQGDPEKMQDWMNSDCAEGWEEMGVQRSTDEVLQARRDYAPDTIPFRPLAIVLTADFRAPEIHYVVRAWSEHETSALLRYGVLPRTSKFDPATGVAVPELDPIRALTFRGPDGVYGVTLEMDDSGWQPEGEIYARCRRWPATVSSKGEETQRQPIQYSRPEKIPGTSTQDPNSIWLVTYQPSVFKEALMAKMAVKRGDPGEWMLHGETGMDYALQVTAERKIETKNKYGRLVWKWKQFAKANHWLDCETMQIVAARFLGVRDMRLEPDAPAATEAPAAAATDAEAFGREVGGFVQRMRRQ